MPIYEYECKACGDVAEVMQKMSAAPPEACPACKGGPLVKLMSKTGFILKGQGWYVTDFRDGKKAKPAEKPAGGEGASGEAPAAPAEGKAADAKAEPAGDKAAPKAPDKPAEKPAAAAQKPS